MRMRALALMLLMASCGGRDGASNEAEAVPGVGGPQSGTRAAAPTISIAATGPGGCAASWDGQQVSPEQIVERGSTLIRQAVDAVGGAQNLTEEALPILYVEAPADLSFACADTILFAVQRSGMFNVRLRPPGRAPVLADFPLDMNAPPPPVPMVLGIGAGGQVTWNNDPIDAAALSQRLGYHGSTAPPDPAEGSPPPGGLELRVTREATFGQLYELLRTTRRYNLRPFLFLPSTEAAPGQTLAPAPPPPPR